MTMLSKDERESLLVQLENANGDTGIKDLTKRLRDDYEDIEYERSMADEERQRLEREREDLKNRYENLREKSFDLFEKIEAKETKEEEKKDIEKDDSLENLTYDNLFTERHKA